MTDDAESVFRVLSDRRRRVVFASLLDHRQLSVIDLATEVAAREADARAEEPDDDRVTEIAFSLHHSHLPKLAECGLVRYDLDRDRVETTDNAAEAVVKARDRLEAILAGCHPDLP